MVLKATSDGDQQGQGRFFEEQRRDRSFVKAAKFNENVAGITRNVL